MEQIKVENLVKSYGNKKGVFDINFSIEKGEVFGFLGPNGAGKTTTIRHLMGFIKPDSGLVQIEGKDCFKEREQIQENVGYLPGEVALMEEMTGNEFLDFMFHMKRLKSKKKMEQLIAYFELDPKGKIRKMSKGMKQKLAIICAFMGEPNILILDEPTSGLDPLMQNKFIDLIVKEKKRGATIFLSSHIFEEIERTCDRVGFIREGELVTIKEMDQLKKSQKRIFEIYFSSIEERNHYLETHKEARLEQDGVSVFVSGEVDSFIKELSQYQISDLKIKTLSLEEIFLEYYEKR